MKARVEVGPVVVEVDGLDLTPAQVRRLLADAGTIATDLLAEDGELEPEPEPEPTRSAVGFTAHIERAESVDSCPYYDDEE